jgi:hypothetical protein
MTLGRLIAGTIPNDPAKTPKDKLEFRGKLMHLHESVGLAMLGFMCKTCERR